MEEEAEVLKIQREKAKTLSMEDFGLENNEQDESDSERQNDMHQVLILHLLLCKSFLSTYRNLNA